MPSGGYQKPEMPAAVSGPGKFSQRTDGQPGATPVQAARYVSGLPQGEGKKFNEEVVGAAPQAAAPSVPTAQQAPQQTVTPAPMPTPLTAPTSNPNEPITSGAPFGEGPNSLPMTEKELMESDEMMKKSVQTLQLLQAMADKEGSNSYIRQAVRRLRGSI